jgi:hypothetical protein
MRGISCNFDNIKTLRTGNRLVQQEKECRDCCNKHHFSFENADFLENRKILAENGEKIIQFSFENHRKSV